MANREKLQPQRKIKKEHYSPKERKERAGSGTELLAGLRAGRRSSPPTVPRAGSAAGRDLQPPPALQSCASFPLPQKEGCFEHHAHTRLISLPFLLVSSPQQMCTAWPWAHGLPQRRLLGAPHRQAPPVPTEQQPTWKRPGPFQVGNRKTL